MRNIKNKKGVMSGRVILMILAVVTLLAILLISKKPLDAAQQTANEKTMDLKMKECSLRVKDQDGNRRANFDSDQYPDCCDPCPTIPNNNRINYPDDDGDGFPTAAQGVTVGCLGNDGNIPYTGSADARMIDVAKYKNQIEKAGGKIETQDNDKNPDIKPVYEVSKISKICS